jgi:hypothetical protein
MPPLLTKLLAFETGAPEQVCGQSKTLISEPLTGGTKQLQAMS